MKKKKKQRPYAVENLKPLKKSHSPLTLSQMYRSCTISPSLLASLGKDKPTEGLVPERFAKAMSLGLGIGHPGYHIFVSGVHSTGKTRMVEGFLKKHTVNKPPPKDWVYVYNFKNPEQPLSLSMAPGEAKKFKKDLDHFIETLRDDIPMAMQSEEYEKKVSSLNNAGNEKKTKLFEELEILAKKKHFGVKSTRIGIVTMPIVDGKPLSEKEYQELSPTQKSKIERQRVSLEPEILEFARKIRAIENKTRELLENLHNDVGNRVIGLAVEPLIKTYANIPPILEYLTEIQCHILENMEDFIPEDSEREEGSEELLLPMSKQVDEFLPYQVNVFVDNTDATGAPIVIENNPTFYNVFGKIEKNIEYGVYKTDFKMIKAGSLARANGGFFVVHASSLLRSPQVWQNLKRVLKTQLLSIEDFGEHLSILATSGLKPQPIPLHVKVVLIGTERIFRLLYQHDEDFQKIFKVKADFNHKMPVDTENLKTFLKHIFWFQKTQNLLPFTKDALERLLEQSIKLTSHQEEMSLQYRLIHDLMLESEHLAKSEITHSNKKISKKEVTKDHVLQALDDMQLRASLSREHMLSMFAKGDVFISTDGYKVGQINILAVYGVGHGAFGIPTRLTCRTYAGKPGIVHIDREATLCGKIHNKGMGILSSWIHATFGSQSPVVLSATICFEQNYGLIDGDSASMAELMVILSTIGNIPLNQGIAMTGSMNQFGEVQPIGGANEKIEGFFALCQQQGLTGKQGVILPKQNIKNLMLHRSIQTAVKAKKFHLWGVSTVEEAFEIMTGKQTGKWLESRGTFTTDCSFWLINKNLHPDDEKPKK